MRVIEPLQHLQLIIDHLFIAFDVLLQDDLDGDLVTLEVCFSDDAICASTECSTEFVLRLLIVGIRLAMKFIHEIGD